MLYTHVYTVHVYMYACFVCACLVLLTVFHDEDWTLKISFGYNVEAYVALAKFNIK